jgi:hypothetical protein
LKPNFGELLKETSMKSRTLMALAVAGIFACGGAFAGGMHHGAQHGMQSSTAEAITPSSVNESAPWLANAPHSAGWTGNASTSTVVGMDDSFRSDSYVGASSSSGGSGYGGFDSMSSSSLGYDSSIYGLDTSLGDTAYVEYWLLGDESYGTGTSSSASGSGYGGFDSMSFSDQGFDSSLAVDDSSGTEQYLVWGPLTQADADDLILVEADSSIAADLTQAALDEGFTVLTPIYDEMADASAFSSDSSFEISQYSPLSGDEDLAT